MAKREERLLDHEYDGIREYDNPTPGWWHFLFLGTVLFSLVYTSFWHGSELAWTPYDSLASDKKDYYGRLFAALGTLQPDEPTMRRLMGDERWMNFGASVYGANCAVCHGAQGTGITGPNLTDNFWINVEKMTDVYRIVTEGVGAKGMPGWGNRLSENERILVAAYVASLRKNPLPGKAPEGKEVPAWDAQPAKETSNGGA